MNKLWRVLKIGISFGALTLHPGWANQAPMGCPFGDSYLLARPAPTVVRVRIPTLSLSHNRPPLTHANLPATVRTPPAVSASAPIGTVIRTPRPPRRQVFVVRQRTVRQVLRDIERAHPNRNVVRIGGGGEGEVYRVEGDGIVYKIAIPRPDVFDTNVLLRNSADIMNRLARAEQRSQTHYFIRGAYDEQVRALRMENFEGYTLGALIGNRMASGESPSEDLRQMRGFLYDRSQGVDRRLEIQTQLLEALRIAHSAGVILRDLKPENILVGWMRDEHGQPVRLQIRIVDFGVSALNGSRPDGSGPDSITGTLPRMSSNQWNNRPASVQDDLERALRFTLRELFEGRELINSSREDLFLRRSGPVSFYDYRLAPTAEATGLSEPQVVALWHHAGTVNQFIRVQSLSQKYRDNPTRFFREYGSIVGSMPPRRAAELILSSPILVREFSSGLGLSGSQQARIREQVELLRREHEQQAARDVEPRVDSANPHFLFQSFDMATGQSDS